MTYDVQTLDTYAYAPVRTVEHVCGGGVARGGGVVPLSISF